MSQPIRIARASSHVDKELRALRGFLAPPMRLKYKYFSHQCVLISLLEQKAKCSVNVSNYFDFYCCYGNKNGLQKKLKMGK